VSVDVSSFFLFFPEDLSPYSDRAKLAFFFPFLRAGAGMSQAPSRGGDRSFFLSFFTSWPAVNGKGVWSPPLRFLGTKPGPFPMGVQYLT